jgi:hypothetical protein
MFLDKELYEKIKNKLQSLPEWKIDLMNDLLLISKNSKKLVKNGDKEL